MYILYYYRFPIQLFIPFLFVDFSWQIMKRATWASHRSSLSFITHCSKVGDVDENSESGGLDIQSKKINTVPSYYKTFSLIALTIIVLFNDTSKNRNESSALATKILTKTISDTDLSSFPDCNYCKK